MVQAGGVFGVHPEGVGAGQGVLVGPLFVQAAVQVGQVGGGGFFGAPAAPAQDGGGELLGVLVGGVAAGAYGGDVDGLAAAGGVGRCSGRSANSRP